MSRITIPFSCAYPLHSISATFCVLVLLSIFPVYVALSYPHHALNDDSLITLTYAKNLAAGHGFVFNHPPPVLGTTTPLFTLLVTALSLIFPYAELTQLATYVSAGCWLGTVWCVVWCRRHFALHLWQAGVIGAIWVASGWVRNLGMEAYLFAFLLVLSITLYHMRRPFLTGCVVALLFLTRYEGLIVLGLLVTLNLLHLLGPDRVYASTMKGISRLLGGFSLVALPWLLYCVITFGTIVPNTLHAKMAQGQLPFGRPFLEQLFFVWAPAWGKPLAFLPWPVFSLWWPLVLLGILYAARHQRRWLIFGAWMILYIVGYVILGVSAYAWYQLPIHFVLQLYLALGIIYIQDAIARWIKQRWLALILFAGLLAFVLARIALPTVLIAWQDPGDKRSSAYRNLAGWLNANTKASQDVAFMEIGYLGYYTNNQIVDLVGLVLPELTSHVASGDLAWGFWHYQPDYYVHSDEFAIWGVSTILADPRFSQNYQLVAEIPGPTQHNLLIYRHVERP